MPTIYLINEKTETVIRLDGDDPEQAYKKSLKPLGYRKCNYEEFIAMKKKALDADDEIVQNE